MDTDCALCDAIADATAGGVPKQIYNELLFTTPRFGVLSSIGPLSLGHVMIVSKHHWPNLASMGVDAIDEYEELVQTFRRLPPYSDGQLLEAESGSTDVRSSGACVVHTHVHWLPGFAEAVDIFDGMLPPIPGVHSLHDVGPEHGAYLFMRNSSETRILEARSLPSQAIRRALFEQIGRDDWDWGVAPRMDRIAETINLWREYQNVL
jgi:hypothetical protein